MSFYVVDIEADNVSPATGSMVCFGAVRVAEGLTDTFYGQTAPISEDWKPDALAISGFSREEHEKFKQPSVTMPEFYRWVNDTNKNGRPVFISDNIAFDWMWIAYYFDRYHINNPFGFSGRRIGDLYCGMVNHSGKNGEWKRKYRKTKHTHYPVDDAKGNAEALFAMKKLGLKIDLT
jgi:DNA polymerase III epsilon subunit-like protein